MDALERFLTYVKINTQSDDKSTLTPSTKCQLDLSNLLVEDLKELGLKDAYLDEFGIVYAHLPGEGEKIGLNAHVDTALEVTDINVNPHIVKNYDGKDIKLSDSYTLQVSQFPNMKDHIGHDLVVTDGNTLLGADDKAGIAIIIGVLSYLKEHPEIKHHPISVSFTPDEEIGRGPENFDLKKMDADYAFTLDGSAPNAIDFRNFNAQAVEVKIQGVSVHPGEGEGKLLNALVLMNEFMDTLPKKDNPYHSHIDEGYWHINSLNGNNEIATADFIIRDFDKEKLEKRANAFKNAIAKLTKKYPNCVFEINIRDQYENMEPYLKKDPRPLLKAQEAIRKNGLTPRSTWIRGGTDGATITKMGLVTPNMGTGSYNHHGRFEFLDIYEFNQLIDIVLDIVKV